MIGYPKQSGPIRARAVRSHESAGRKNYQTKPISYNQQGINGLRVVSSTVGRSDRQNPTDRTGGGQEHLCLRAGAPEEQQGNNGLSEQPSYLATELPNKPNSSELYLIQQLTRSFWGGSSTVRMEISKVAKSSGRWETPDRCQSLDRIPAGVEEPLVRPAAAVGSCLPADALGKLQTLDYFGQVFGEVTEALGFRLTSQQTLLEREFQRQSVGQVEAGLQHRGISLQWLESEHSSYLVGKIESLLKPFRVGRCLRGVLEVFDPGLEIGETFVERDGFKPLPAAGLYIEAPVVIALRYALHYRRATHRRKLPSGL